MHDTIEQVFNRIGDRGRPFDGPVLGKSTEHIPTSAEMVAYSNPNVRPWLVVHEATNLIHSTHPVKPTVDRCGALEPGRGYVLVRSDLWWRDALLRAKAQDAETPPMPYHPGRDHRRARFANAARTKQEVLEYVSLHPEGVTPDEVVDNVPHHWKNRGIALGCLIEWAERQSIPGVRAVWRGERECLLVER